MSILRLEGTSRQELSKEEKEKEDKGKKRKSEDSGERDSKRRKKEVANVVEDEIITFLVNEEEGQDFNYDTFDVSNSLGVHFLQLRTSKHTKFITQEHEFS